MMFILLALPLHPIGGPAEHYSVSDGNYGMHCLAQEVDDMPEYLAQGGGHCDTWRVIQSTCGWNR